MSDLIARLRQSSEMQFYELDACAHEAADEIERLTARNAEFEAALQTMYSAETYEQLLEMLDEALAAKDKP